MHSVVRLADRPKREVTAAMLDSFGPRRRAFRESRDALMESRPFQSRPPAIEQAVRAMRRGDQFDRRGYGVPGESRRLNRHAILHGSARRYGTRENSLKLFLLLVALAEVLDYYAEQAATDEDAAAA